MRIHYIICFWVIVLTHRASASVLSKWIERNRDRGVLHAVESWFRDTLTKINELVPTETKPPPPIVTFPPVPDTPPPPPTIPSPIPTVPTAQPKPIVLPEVLTTTTTTTPTAVTFISTAHNHAENNPTPATTPSTFDATTTMSSIIETDATLVGIYSKLTSYLISSWTTIAYIASTTILIFIILVCCCKRKKTIPDTEKFQLCRPPSFTIFNKQYFYLHQRVDKLEYDPSYETARKNVKLGAHLGIGNFGIVCNGTLNVDRQWKNRNCLDVFRTSETRKVAVKSIGAAASQEAVLLRKRILDDELKLMCCVGAHPNIVTLLGAVTLGKETLIVMDMCSIGDLKKFLLSKQEGFIMQFEKDASETPIMDRDIYIGSTAVMPVNYKKLDPHGDWKTDLSNNLTTAHLLSFAMQIAQGMDYLTSIKCIHRDLAARNILLTPEGLCKIADFGLAKRIWYKEYYRTDTVQELPAKWMSLESLQTSVFTVESDIWSYGILLYEIFTLGDNPYPTLTGDPSDAIINGARNEQPIYCHDAIYEHMKLCWSTETNRRPSFRTSAELMKTHLYIASSEVLQKVECERLLEEEKQRKFITLRAQKQQSRSSSNIIQL